jgi:hypothetical protein
MMQSLAHEKTHILATICVIAMPVNKHMHVCGMQAQLQSLFGLSEEETRTVIQSSEYVFEQVLSKSIWSF